LFAIIGTIVVRTGVIVNFNLSGIGSISDTIFFQTLIFIASA
jgi:hypothetical protein